MALIKCSECGKEISSKAIACPQCGAKQSKPLHKRWWVRLLAIIMVVFFMLIISVVTDPENELEVLSSQLVKADATHKKVIGKVKNNSDVDFDFVSIHITGYDRKGNVVDTTADHIGFLGAGDTWEFETVGWLDNDVYTYEITDLNAR